MLAYRLTILIFILSSGATILFADELKFSLLLGLCFILLIIISIGSAKIQLGFFKKAFCKKKVSEKVIALTFDDGPDNNTSEILNLLQVYDARATFFCIGNKVAPHASNLKRMINSGHEIGCHSLKHRSFFPILFTSTIVSEIEETNRIIEEITGQKVHLFRPPFGVTNPRIVRAINITGMKLIGWSIRSYDTVSISKEKILNRVIRRIGPGKIVLLHDTSLDVLWVLEQLLKELKCDGYKFVTISELDLLS